MSGMFACPAGELFRSIKRNHPIKSPALPGFLFSDNSRELLALHRQEELVVGLVVFQSVGQELSGAGVFHVVQ